MVFTFAQIFTNFYMLQNYSKLVCKILHLFIGVGAIWENLEGDGLSIQRVNGEV